MKKAEGLSRRKFLLSVAVAVLTVAIAFSIGWASTVVQGKVTLIDWCSGVVFVDNVPYNAEKLDLSGLDEGDRVRVIYTNTSKGQIVESIQVIRGEE
ncbi:MAG: hypothetical protein ACUVUQ_06450 [Thermodesulfovibrionales bacterium]